MKLPSMHQLLVESRATLVRFPVVLCVAAAGTVAALVLADHEGPAEASPVFNILLASILGIPLLIALALFAEKRHLKKPGALGLQVIGILLLAAYAITVPTDLTRAPLVTLFRFFLLAAALHLFTAVAPFTSKGQQNGFWHYNKTLFLRILTTGVYSGVLFLGLVIALAALENLFGIDVPEKRYLELFIAIAGLFATWFFLAGIPEDLSQLDTLTDYPKGLKIFAQYILLPIVLIYFIILYAYLAKILFAWDWPQGWVSKLILGYSGVGMFMLLLLHPVVGHTENRWIARASRWFYILLIPLVVVLILAVWRRVSEYGMTEGRYIAVALGGWLAFLMAYFTLSKTKSIKVIPASLCVCTLLVTVGPWGMFSIARQSQIGRLERILTQSGILADGSVRPLHGEVPSRDAREISAILSYLHETHGLGEIQGWFRESLKEDTVASGVAYKSPSTVAKMMGVEYVTRWAESPEGIVTLEAEGGFDVNGYDRMLHATMYTRGIKSADLLKDSIVYRVTEGCKNMTFVSARTGADLLQIDLWSHIEPLLKEYSESADGRIANDKMSVSAAGNGLRVRVCPWLIQFQRHGGETRVTRVVATILYSVEANP